MGMMHSSTYTALSRKYQHGSAHKAGGYCPAADGFSEYGDGRCIMGGGQVLTFNAPQRLIHGWITTAPQFTSSNIYPSGSLSSPPASNSEVCICSEADFSASYYKKVQAFLESWRA